MEFSIFVLASVLAGFLVYRGLALWISFADRKWSFLSWAVVPLCWLFFGLPAALTVLVFLAFAFGVVRIPRLRKWLRGAAGYSLLLLLCLGYFPQMNRIWQKLQFSVLSGICRFPKIAALIDVYQVFQYFRFALPAAIALVALLALETSDNSHPRTAWVRFYNRFDHRHLALLLVAWGLAFLLDRLGESGVFYRELCLNLALLETGCYAVFGVMTIIRGMKIRRIPEYAAASILIGLLALSGRNFPLVVTFAAGMGVTDIWMGYFRGSSRRKVG